MQGASPEEAKYLHNLKENEIYQVSPLPILLFSIIHDRCFNKYAHSGAIYMIAVSRRMIFKH
jgi:hypothetical protein